MRKISKADPEDRYTPEYTMTEEEEETQVEEVRASMLKLWLENLRVDED